MSSRLCARQYVNRFTRMILVASLPLYFAGCGNTSSGPSQPSQSAAPLASSSESTSPESTNSESSSSSSSVPLLPASFIDPITGESIVIELTPQNTSLEPRGSTSFLLNATDTLGVSIPFLGEVTINSPCLTSETASFLITLLPDDSVNVNYTAKTGCYGEDLITVDILWNTELYTTEVLLDIEPELISNVEWLNTDPSIISIRGSGAQEVATVNFILRSNNGEPIENEEVSFSFEGASGGATLNPLTATSDINGQVTTQVRAGTSPSTITIKATHLFTGETAPSSGLIVASGTTVQGNFALATNTFNPAGFNRIGSPSVDITASATDRAGNPVPNGTSINFTSQEGGSITPNCILINGNCTISFTPNGVQPPDGRIQILAVIKGSEDFNDINGNSVFDDNDIFTPEEHSEGEPYSDNNNNGEYDLGEHFTDTNNNAQRDGFDEIFDGPNCKHSSLCSPGNDFIDLGKNITLTLSDWREPTICAIGNFPAFDSQDVVLISSGDLLSLTGLFLSDGNQNADNSILEACLQGNPLPAGTLIEFTSNSGTLLGTTRWIIPTTATLPTGPYGLNYKADDTAGSDIIALTITSTNGQVSTFQMRVNISGNSE